MKNIMSKLYVTVVIACLGTGYVVGSTLKARLQQAGGFESSPDTGVIKGSGRCIAVANATDNPVELTFQVYSDGGGFFKRIGKKKADVSKAVKLKPDDIVSFNQKPKLSVLKGGVAGDYQYIEGLTLKVYDKTGKKLEKVHVLNSQQVAELNRYIARVLNDQSACKDSEDDREEYAIIVADSDQAELIQTCSGKADELCTIDFASDYSLVVPFAREKTFLGRLSLHGKHHKKSFQQIGRTLGNATKAALIIAGTGGVATGPALAKFTADTMGQLQDVISELPDSNIVQQELQNFADLADVAKDITSVADAFGFKEDLKNQFNGVVDGFISKVGGEQTKELLKGIKEAGEQILSGDADSKDVKKAMEDVQSKAKALEGAKISDADAKAAEAASASLAHATALMAEAEQKEDAAEEAAVAALEEAGYEHED